MSRPYTPGNPEISTLATCMLARYIREDPNPPFLMPDEQVPLRDIVDQATLEGKLVPSVWIGPSDNYDRECLPPVPHEMRFVVNTDSYLGRSNKTYSLRVDIGPIARLGRGVVYGGGTFTHYSGFHDVTEIEQQRALREIISDIYREFRMVAHNMLGELASGGIGTS